MKIIKFTLLIFIFLNNISFSDEKNILLENKILKNIRCLICQGQSVYDSQSDFQKV